MIRFNWKHTIFLITIAFNSTAGQAKQSGSDSIDLNKLTEKINYWYYSNFDSVLKYSKEIINEAGKTNLFEKQIESIFLLFTCGTNFNRVPESYPYLELANELIDKQKEKIVVIDSTGYLRASVHFLYALYHYYMGNYPSSIDEFFIASETCNDSDLIGSAYKFIGQCYYNSGNYDKSIHFFKLSDEFIQNPGNKGQALNLMYEGEYYFALGNTSTAFTKFRKSFELLEKEKGSEATNSLKSIYMLIGEYYFKSKQYDSAIFYSNQGMNYFLTNDRDFTDSYNFLADVYYEQNLNDSALKYYNKSLQVSHSIHKNSHYTKYKALFGIANIYRDQANHKKALEFYNRSLSNLPVSAINKNRQDFTQALMPVETMKVLVGKARLFLSWYDSHNSRIYLDSALGNLKKALTLNELNRRELLSIESKETKSDVQFNITDLGLRASFQAFYNHREENDAELIFMFMEKRKANILLDQIDEAKAREFSGVPKNLINKESRLKGEISYYRNLLVNTKSDENDFKKISSDYNRKLKEYIDVMDILEKEHTNYYRLKYNTSTVKLHDLKKSMPANSILIEFSISTNKIFVVAASKKNLVLKTIDRNSTFNQNLKSLLHLISTPLITETENDPSLFDQFANSSTFLYKELIEPVLKDFPASIKKLIIIPEGELCYLPFELLLTSSNINKGIVDYKELPYLIKKYNISYDYSSSIWKDNLKEKSIREVMYTGYAPGDFMNAQSLKASRVEVEMCSDLWHGRCLIGESATETSIKLILPENSILHLATHAVLNDEDPLQSSLKFSIDPKSSDDGTLLTSEIYNMNIPAKLIILSGCETGMGGIRNGEGIISLARAFKYAGCQNIIMSLWKVNDLATKDIIVAFNKNLKHGMSKGRALQKAKLSFIKSSGNPHPAYWSSFVLIGNNKPVRPKYTLYYLIPAILVILVFLIKRKIIS